MVKRKKTGRPRKDIEIDRILREKGFPGLAVYLRAKDDEHIGYRIIANDLERLTGVRINPNSVMNYIRKYVPTLSSHVDTQGEVLEAVR